jgi:signal transduction histidine kinase
LSREEAEKGLPVKIRGTVVLQIGKGRVFNIHDGRECIAVHFFKAQEQALWKSPAPPPTVTEYGADVEIEGITGPAGYVPVIIPTRIHRVGTGMVPPARRVSMERLISGSEVSQYVEVEGVIQNVLPLSGNNAEMSIVVEGQTCDIKIHNAAKLDPDAYVDARVRIRGCSSPIFNLRSEATGIRLIVQDPQHIEILRPPPKDPFLAPRVPLKGLLPFAREPEVFHRKVTQGVVNFALPGKFFFLQEGNAGVRVDSPGAVVRVGDAVEVAGFVETSRHIASLTGAVARRTGKGEVPAPVPVSASQLLNPTVANPLEPVTKQDHFGSLVRLSGTIRNNEWDDANRQVRLLVDSDGTLFTAVIPDPDPDHAPHTRWAEGSAIDISGVCELEFEPGEKGAKSPVVTGFKLWSRDPADIVVLHAPSWWTPLRLSVALGGSLAVLALALVWASALRLQVKRQMAVISHKLQNEAVIEERNRMARDLHDTLEQQLAGVSLQLDDIQETVREDPRAAQDALDLARRMLDFTRTEARRSVWDLRSQILELHGLETAIRAMAESGSHLSRPIIQVNVTGEPRRLPAADSYNLLRMCQESLANALKHAHAGRIDITIEYLPEEVRLTVSDDGQGLAPGMLEHSANPHFGVLGMRERARKIGAALKIDGNPGAGCTVSIVLPAKP